MKVWQLVARAQKAQENILKRLESRSQCIGNVQESEQNQFLSTKILKQVSSNNFASFAQSLKQSAIRELPESKKSIEQSSYSFVIDINGHAMEFDARTQSETNFECLIRKVEGKTGKRVSQKGLQKLLSIFNRKIEEIKSNNEDSVQWSVKESKVQQKSTMKNSMMSRTNPGEKNNKQNYFKIGQMNYQNMSKVKKGQTPTFSASRAFASRN